MATSASTFTIAPSGPSRAASPQACAAEFDYLRALIPAALVQRATHKTSGAHTCAYDIRFATASSAHASTLAF